MASRRSSREVLLKRIAETRREVARLEALLAHFDKVVSG